MRLRSASTVAAVEASRRNHFYILRWLETWGSCFDSVKAERSYDTQSSDCRHSHRCHRDHLPCSPGLCSHPGGHHFVCGGGGQRRHRRHRRLMERGTGSLHPEPLCQPDGLVHCFILSSVPEGEPALSAGHLCCLSDL